MVMAAAPGIVAAQEPIRSEVKAAVAIGGKLDEASKIEALTKLSALLSTVAKPSPLAGLIEGLRGAVLSDLRRPQAALAAFQSATRQYDGNPEIYRLWIAYELDLGTPETVAGAFQRTAEVQPQILATLDKNWVQSAFQKTRKLPADKREALADRRAAPGV